MKRAVVLDTNCLVQMLSVHSPYRSAWQAFRDGKYELCVTDDIVDEYEEIIERVANAAVAHNIVNAIIRSPYTRFFTPHFRFRLIEQDPDDNPLWQERTTLSARMPTSGYWKRFLFLK